MRGRVALRLATTSGRRISPLQRALHAFRDADGAAQLVLVLGEFAADEDRVEGEAVRRREDLGIDDVGAGGGAGAGDDRQEPRMIGRRGWSAP